MKWSPEADAAIRKVPFFVRKKVRARVEAIATEAGKAVVSIEDVQSAKERFINNMAAEVKGYRLDTCFGPGGCPNRAIESGRLLKDLEDLFEKADLLAFLKETVNGPLKFHHEFKVTLADCPNACSQPQIKDIGIIGATEPAVTDAECISCGACEPACREGAISFPEEGSPPVIDMDRCLYCGQCATACPTGTIAAGRQGYRVLLGGKLGRHPRLARELPGIFDEQSVIDIVSKCIVYYKGHSFGGRRFAELLAMDKDFINRVLTGITSC